LTYPWNPHRSDDKILMKGSSEKELRKRVDATLERGYKIISNPEIQEQSGPFGRMEYICLVKKIEDKVKTPSK